MFELMAILYTLFTRVNLSVKLERMNAACFYTTFYTFISEKAQFTQQLNCFLWYWPQ